MSFPAAARAQLSRLPSAFWTWSGLAVLAIAYLPWQAVLVNLLVAPWLEELLFREGLQRRLQTKFRAALGPVLLTAAAFAAAHALMRPDALSWATFLPALVVGMLYARRQNLALCVWFHAAFNFVWLVGLAPLLVVRSITL